MVSQHHDQTAASFSIFFLWGYGRATRASKQFGNERADGQSQLQRANRCQTSAHVQRKSAGKKSNRAETQPENMYRTYSKVFNLTYVSLAAKDTKFFFQTEKKFRARPASVGTRITMQTKLGSINIQGAHRIDDRNIGVIAHGFQLWHAGHRAADRIKVSPWSPSRHGSDAGMLPQRFTQLDPTKNVPDAVWSSWR